jgi:hypothetical protein
MLRPSRKDAILDRLVSNFVREMRLPCVGYAFALVSSRKPHGQSVDFRIQCSKIPARLSPQAVRRNDAQIRCRIFATGRRDSSLDRLFVLPYFLPEASFSWILSSPDVSKTWREAAIKTIGAKKKDGRKKMARRTTVEVCCSATVVVAFLLSRARVEAQTFSELEFRAELTRMLKQ